jgi:hypothetical protein
LPRDVALHEEKLVRAKELDLATLKSIYGQEAEFGFGEAS